MKIQVLCICSSRALFLGTLRTNVLLKNVCDCPQELLRKISDLASELHNTKVTLDQDESELRKDRELLIKDKQASFSPAQHAQPKRGI